MKCFTHLRLLKKGLSGRNYSYFLSPKNVIFRNKIQMETDNRWREIVATFATIWTILQMLSPLPSCYHFMKTKSVGDMIVTPYVAALCSCSLWLFYGYLKEDTTVIRVNMVGAGLQLGYILCYYAYSIKKGYVMKQVIAGACVVSVAFIYTQIESELSEAVPFLGFYCSCVTVAFFASPLANMFYVIRVWNSESLPRLLIASTFIVSLQWTIYGHIIADRYILLTNLMGAFLSAIQLSMLLIIPREPNAKPITDSA